MLVWNMSHMVLLAVLPSGTYIMGSLLLQVCGILLEAGLHGWDGKLPLYGENTAVRALSRGIWERPKSLRSGIEDREGQGGRSTAWPLSGPPSGLLVLLGPLGAPGLVVVGKRRAGTISIAMSL